MGRHLRHLRPAAQPRGARAGPVRDYGIKDYGDFDNASKLDRPGVFRLNIGVSRKTFDPLFPEEVDHDFTALDVLMPHPVYGRNHWVCVLNPSDATFEKLKPLLAEAHDTAFRRIERRSSASGSDAGRPSTSTSSQ
ncbi:MAG TPA: DUF6194 family protein [Methylomirabilota bacterium]|nr:DUF6194 family protein [Methylomirabilota bacterium]